MRWFLALFVVTPLVVAASAAAKAPRDLPISDVFYPTGKFTSLAGGVYQASKFPLAVRLSASAGWTGAQWKANTFSPEEIAQRHLKCPRVCQPPYYGWVAVAKGGLSATRPPTALILVMTGYGTTPSVAATVASLHRPRGVTYEPPAPVRLAGSTGTQFEGQTVGAGTHYFIPFTPPSHSAAGGGGADTIEMPGAGHSFRFTVLNVRGRTVVILVGSLVLSSDEFQTFLATADGVLGSLAFPR
jgi:hypothetical protein